MLGAGSSYSTRNDLALFRYESPEKFIIFVVNFLMGILAELTYFAFI